MKKTGIVEKSNSPWQSPILVVGKKDGSLRFCIDFRKVNAVTKTEAYPLPRIDEILDCLGSSKCTIFSSVDLAAGFWQIAMEDKSKEVTAFALPKGVFINSRLCLSGLKMHPEASKNA